MATLTVDDGDDRGSSGFKHFCKICKKGFFCGRALGGHMRAHGINGGDDSGGFDRNMDEYEDEYEYEDESPPPSSENNKRMYALRTNPNRLTRSTCRVCENCGKEFESWNLFLEHYGQCNSSDVEQFVSSSLFPAWEDDEENKVQGWTKRKRSSRTAIEVDDNDDYYLNSNVSNSTTINVPISPSNEEEDLANCLMMLSNATVYHSYDEPSFSPNMTRSLPPNFDHARLSHQDAANRKRGIFECKACKKVFNSHQALGGHRASHKKVKGCFAARLDQDHNYQHNYNYNNSLTTDQDLIGASSKSIYTKTTMLQLSNNISPKKKSRVHECSICHRVFSSGQALGGHKRCHWITSNINVPNSDPYNKKPTLSTTLINTPNNYQRDNVIGILPRDPKNPLSFEVSTDVDIPQQKINEEQVKDDNEEFDDNMNVEKIIKRKDKDIIKSESSIIVEDEEESKVKLAKLCELQDHMNTTHGSSSSWLQVGIGSVGARN